MKVNYYGMTDTGLVRQNNEDAFVLQKIWDDNHILCVVIDGLGGYEGGEVAAEIAVSVITAFLSDNREGKALELLKKAVTEANNAVVSAKADQPRLARMGCVLTACIIDLQARQLNVAHIGDTRLYRINGGCITKLTHDHAIVGYMEETGQLTEEDAMNHPYRNVIERFLGEDRHLVDDPQFIDAAIFPITSGEALLLCSDGLSDMLTSAEILNDVSPNCEETVKDLIRDANEKGGRDNVTVIAVAFTDPSIPISDSDISDEKTTHIRQEPSIREKVPLRSMLAKAWLPCLLSGLIMGYTAGNHNMAISIKVYEDSLTAVMNLADSLQSVIDNSIKTNDSIQDIPDYATANETQQ